MGSPLPADPQGVLGHLPAALGMQRGFGVLLAPPGMLGRRAFGVFGISKHVGAKLLGSWHLQHVGSDTGVLPSGMWEELRSSWHLQMCCGGYFGSLGSPFMLGGFLRALSIFWFVWGRRWGKLAPPSVPSVSGGFHHLQGSSWHLQMFCGSLKAPVLSPAFPGWGRFPSWVPEPFLHWNLRP